MSGPLLYGSGEGGSLFFQLLFSRLERPVHILDVGGAEDY